MAELPLLLICGIGSDADSWRAQKEAIGAERPCIAVVPHGETIAEMSEHALSVAPPRFAVAGHSLGGYVALAMIRAAPERVDRIALVNTSARADSVEQAAARHKLLALAERKGFMAVAARLAATVAAGDTGLCVRYLAMLRRTGHARFIRDQHAATTRADSRPLLPGIRCPTLVIGSSRDPVVPPEASPEIVAHVPGAWLLMLESGSHAGPMAEPEKTTRALRDWLDK